MTACHAIRPLLPARVDELTLAEVRTRAEHVAACTRCAAEAAAYTRLGQALSTMAGLEVDPADGTLERILVAIGRRRTGVTGPRVLAAAGASGALVATVVVARAVHHRRQVQHRQVLRSTRRRPRVGRLRLPSLPVPTPALARAK
jgi:anti-sigma factor RsiW